MTSLPDSGSSGLSQRKTKGVKAAPAPMAPTSVRYGEGAAAVNGGLTLRDPVTGAQYVQIQLLQVRFPAFYSNLICFPSTLCADLV